MPVRLLIACVVVAALAAASLAAAATPTHRLGDVQQRLGKANGKLRSNRRRAVLLTDDISAFNGRIRGLEARLATLRGQVGQAGRRLETADLELGRRQRDLRTERAKLVRLRARLANARITLANRLVSLYKADNPDVLTVVLESDGFARLLDDAAFLNRIGRQDKLVLEAVRTARAEAERQTARLTRLEAQQRTVTDRLGREHDRVTNLQDGVLAARSQLATARDARERRLSATRVSGRRLREEVSSLQAAQGRIQRSLAAAQRKNSGEFGGAVGPVQPGSGGWVWPVSGPITSTFCERRSYEACHPGLDIGVPEGTPIRAAKSGRVVLMQPTAASGGYGNYTCVQHDSSTASCYAHQSRFGTSVGARVATGQVIGYVGNTGHSFGAHLHFEVRVNGSVVNPLNYL
ncbi:MAG: murein hydrolase activator EnvC family protein [Solirubrobacteraceae bacterium]